MNTERAAPISSMVNAAARHPIPAIGLASMQWPDSMAKHYR